MAQQPGIDRLSATGFCIGGHLAFRAAFDPRVAATVCFYPTGLHNGRSAPTPTPDRWPGPRTSAAD